MRGPRGVAWGVLLSVLASAGCEGDTRDDRRPPVTVPVQFPTLELSPAPGSYQAYRLEVSVTAPDEGYGLYFALDDEPRVAANLRAEGRFAVQLAKSTQLQVIVEAPDGRLYGPVSYEYILEPTQSDAWCQLDVPPRVYYQTGQKVPVAVKYKLPVSLARPELVLDGEVIVLAADDYAGAVTTDVGPFSHDRSHRVQCLVRLPGGTAWAGNTWDFVVDGTPPEIGWITTDFTHDRDTWKNELRLEAGDAFTGLERVEICRAPDDVCLALEEAGSGPGAYVYSTALTDGTSVQPVLYARAIDLAGNERLAPQRTLDLTAFAEPWSAQAGSAIAMVTAAHFDLLEALGGSVADVRLLHADGWQPYTDALHAVALSPGWNEFAYRRTGKQSWETFAVYRAGLSISLPEGADWLVYASNGTSPAGEWRLSAELPGGGLWEEAWLDVPHLLFVEDVEPDGRWGSYDRVFTDAADAFAGRADSPPWRSRGEPVVFAPVQWNPPPPALTEAAVLAVEEGVAADRVVFEWRAERNDYPALHHSWDGLSFPADVSVPASGWCTFFADRVSEGVSDGILNRGEARVSGPCGATGFEIATRPAPFAPMEMSELPPEEILALVVYGVAYGSAVTGEVVYRVPGSLSDSGVIARYPLTGDYDEAVPGAAWFFEPWLYPRLEAELRVWNLDASVPAQSFTAAPEEACVGCAVEVRVIDEEGGDLQALIHVDGQVDGLSDVTGRAMLSDSLVFGQELWAFRQNRLLEKLYVTAPTDVVNLRLLEHSLTVTGVVRDHEGSAVRGAVLRWESDGYLSETTSDDSGAYALPVSDPWGTITMSWSGNGRQFTRSESVSAEAIVDFSLPRPPAAHDPRGLISADGAPVRVCGHFAGAGMCLSDPPASLVTRSAYDAPYWTLVTAASMTGEWWAEWEYMSRKFVLPGSLPSFRAENTAGFQLPISEGLDLLAQEAWCGQWRQEPNGALLAHADCWTWLASDARQTYVLANLNTLGAPSHAGLGLLSATVNNHGGGTPGNQLVVLTELILGRSIQAWMNDGYLEASVPHGVYEAHVLDGRRLLTDDPDNLIRISPVHPTNHALTLP